MERNDKCFCGSGKKYKKCHCHINVNSIIAKIYESRVNYLNECAKLQLLNKCIIDCYQCCNNNFCISEQEFLLILDYLIMRNIDVKQYINKSKEVIVYAKENYPQIIDVFNKKLESNDLSLDNILLCFDTEVKCAKWPYCIFLNEGKCSIYEVRPMMCRLFGTTMKCDNINNRDIDSTIFFDRDTKRLIKIKL